MMVLICYDVETTSKEGKTRLRRVAKALENYAQRVQHSVFEANVDFATFVQLKHTLTQEIDKKSDSLRFYYLGNNWKKRVEHIGAKEGYDTEGFLVF